MNSQAIRESVNEKMIEALSNNVLPWRRPWSGGNGGRHRNFATNRAYSGVNPLLLEIHNLKHGLSSNRWATFRQWQAMDCSVKKRPSNVPAGKWGCPVIFCKPVKKTAGPNGKKLTLDDLVKAGTAALRVDARICHD